MNSTDTYTHPPAPQREQFHLLSILHGLASLKFTLVLLSLAMLLILFGTLAQAKIGMWDVLAQYFKSYWVWVRVQELVPRAWATQFHDSLPSNFGFPFIGGKSIGLAMMTNLVLAHALKFQIRARGMRLSIGGLTLIFGMVLTYAIIALGQYQQGVSDAPVVTWATMAKLTNVSAVAITVSLFLIAASLAGQAYAEPATLAWPKAILALCGALFATLVCVLLFTFKDDISALRILWQLIQGTIAGLVLLGGCWMLFEKRAGIVLLHGGIALMMFGEWWVTVQAKEQQMQIVEGTTALYANDIRTAELAIVETLVEEEKHVVIPEQWLVKSSQHSKRITDERLPFDLEVLAYYKNSQVQELEDKDQNLATRGRGLKFSVKEAAVNSGASSDGEVDLPAAYVRILDKKSGEDLGVYLAALIFGLDGPGESIRLGEKRYALNLRFEREYKPYAVKLHDFRREDYPGSNTPKSYESKIQMIDPARKVDREVRISMNNPFRYMGETFYQSSFRPADATGRETTVLQIVTNTGWMIPYVSCMLVFVGLMYQFGRTLLLFLAGETNAIPLNTEEVGAWDHLPAGHRPAIRSVPLVTASAASVAEPWWKWFVPSVPAWLLMAIALIVIVGGMRTPKVKPNEYDLYSFGKIPVMSGGRAKPLDSLARETMLTMMNDVYYKDITDKRQPAIKWLLETIAVPDKADMLRVLRLESNEVAEALGLELQRDYRYSFNELRENAKKVQEQFEKLSGKEETQYTVFDNQLMKLEKRLQTRIKTAGAFETIDLIGMFKSFEATDDPSVVQQRLQAAAQMVISRYQDLDRSQAPLGAPVQNEELRARLGGKRWLPLSTALAMYDMQKLNPHSQGEEDLPIALWREIIAAYREEKPAEFNAAVTRYLGWCKEQEHADFSADRVGLESLFNHINPFGWTQGIILYVFSFLVSVISLMAWQKPLGKAAFWLLFVTFILHTVALGARMYIAGRPPVTNLYSSAVFIGWAVVLMGLFLEGWFRLNVGNLLAALGGFGSLRIALALSFEGDTIGVMQAVLDTQFWLATHVVCITFGYAATFVAGFLGVLYIVLGVATPALTSHARSLMGRMIYGVVCFALLLSFFGTVLGGLWADDSWGRFWGWDPKENGALLIVLWNAIILHARWDRLVKDRGLAVLAVFGNIVTSWSWFGTNQLGVGLHSYGFTQGTLVALTADLFINLIIIGIGCLPLAMWWSYRAEFDNEQANNVDEPILAK